MKFLLSLLTFVVFGFFALNTNANLRTIAEKNQQAAGFPVGTIYRNLEVPVIGNGGQVAFSGRVWSSSSPSEAIWYGQPGQLEVAIQERESPAGFPANVIFSSAIPETLTLSDSGNLAFAAIMDGARYGKAYLASINGTTHGVIQEGVAATGFPPGTTIETLQKFVFADPGMAFKGWTSQAQGFIWFWNKHSIEPVTSTDTEFSQLYPGCKFSSLSLLDMSRDGEILFRATFDSTGTASCPDDGLFTWKTTTFRQIAVAGQHPPGMPDGTVFASGTFTSESINDNGDVSFQAQTIDTGQDFHRASWIVYASGDMAPVALEGETLPNRPAETLILDTGASAANRNAATILRAKSSTNARLLLAGPPKQGANYTDLSHPGTSHLDVLLRSDEPPPGFESSWYLQKIVQAQINNQDNYSLWVNARDATDTNTQPHTQIWQGSDAASLRLLVMENEPVLIDGLSGTLNDIQYPWVWANTPDSSNSGQPLQFNDFGQLVFLATREENSHQILLMGMAATPECSGQVVGIPARTYADGEIIYCVGDESLSTVANESIRVTDGADVTYESPALHFNNGFSVAAGGRFSAITP
jgi:hypothetical protein